MHGRGIKRSKIGGFSYCTTFELSLSQEHNEKLWAWSMVWSQYEWGRHQHFDWWVRKGILVFYSTSAPEFSPKKPEQTDSPKKVYKGLICPTGVLLSPIKYVGPEWAYYI